MLEEKELLLKFENEYKTFIDNKGTPSLRKKSAYKIAISIIDFNFLKKNRENDFQILRGNRINKIKKNKSKVKPYQEIPYSDDYSGRLRFLCDFNYIPLEFKNLFNVLLSLKNKSEKENVSKSDISFLSLHELLNTILEWFCESEFLKSDFIEPLNIVSGSNQTLQTFTKNKIDSFFNLKKNIGWFEKYRTIISYILVLSLMISTLLVIVYLKNNSLEKLFNLNIQTLIVFFLLLLTIVSVTSINRTNKYVTNKFLRFSRFSIFGLGITPLIFIMLYALITLFISHEQFEKWLGYQEVYPIFDRDPHNKGSGFLFVSSPLDYKKGVDGRKKIISTDSLFGNMKVNAGKFDVFFDIKNIGTRKFDSLAYNVSVNFLDSTRVKIQIRPILYHDDTVDMIEIIKKKNEGLLIVNCRLQYKMKTNQSKTGYVLYEQEYPTFNLYRENKLPDINPVDNSSLVLVSLIIGIKVIRK